MPPRTEPAWRIVVADATRTWTFKLRKKFALERRRALTRTTCVHLERGDVTIPLTITSPTSCFASTEKVRVTKVDDLTVRVVTPEVFAPFVEYFGGMLVLPGTRSRRRCSREIADSYAAGTPPEKNRGLRPVSVEGISSRSVRPARAQSGILDHRQSGARLPYFDEVMLIVTRNPSGRPSFFSTARGAHENISRDEWPSFQQPQPNGSRIVECGPGAQRDFLWFNQNTGVGADGKPLVDPVKLKCFGKRNSARRFLRHQPRPIVTEVYGGRAQAGDGSSLRKIKSGTIRTLRSTLRSRPRPRAAGRARMAECRCVLRMPGQRRGVHALSNFDNPAAARRRCSFRTA